MVWPTNHILRWNRTNTEGVTVVDICTTAHLGANPQVVSVPKLGCRVPSISVRCHCTETPGHRHTYTQQTGVARIEPASTDESIATMQLCSRVCSRGSLHNVPRSYCYSFNLVDPASSHMLVSKIKPCMSKCKSTSAKL